MKLSQPKNNKKLAAILTGSILLAVTATALSYSFGTWPFDKHDDNSINLSKPTKEELQAGEQAKKQTVNQTNAKNNNTGSDPSLAPQPIEGSDKKSINMEITATNQTDSILQIRTLIQTVINTGECSLSMKGPDGAAYNAKADVQALASSSTCKGFDISLDQLTPGAWTITVSFDNDELSSSTTKEIGIK